MKNNVPLGKRLCRFIAVKSVSGLLALLLLSPAVRSQINAYARVTALSGATLNLSYANQAFHTFAVGEQIIIMQMQDTVIGADTAHNATFGMISSIANAGVYEVATISSVAGMPASMVLTGPLTHTYNTNTNARVQIISFNSLGTSGYTTTSTITGIAWNGNIGGVVAFQVGGKLTLNNKVTADGLGFRGGAFSADYEVRCEPSVYDTTSSNYAYKGEGIYASPTISYTTHNGRAPLVTGGGGGSDDNAGGGGGGNYTAGGQGGQGWTCNTASASGGFGGVSLLSYITGNRVFMGGGGGGGQENNNVGTAGTAGGGIIIIKADTLTTSCSGSDTLTASGVVGTTSGNDGAGGGGAGGTIVLKITTYSVPASCPLTVQSNGGNGGNVGDANSHGGGGGGGQGAIVYSNAIPTTNITSNTTNGTGGLNSSSAGASSAANAAGVNNSGVVVTAVTLAVDFLSFSAQRNGQDADLSWTTGPVLQPVTFSIQRSKDGVSFEPIGSVAAPASSESDNSNEYTDLKPGEGKVFYRIAETEFSGRVIYSSVVSLDFSGSTNVFGIYPNPSSGSFTIRLTESTTSSVPITIEDMIGNTVYTGVIPASSTQVPVSTGRRLASGIYIVRLINEGRPQIGRLLIR